MSLRTKGLLLIALLVAYYVGVGVLLLRERATLLGDVAMLQRLYSIQEGLAEVGALMRLSAPHSEPNAGLPLNDALRLLDAAIQSMRVIEALPERLAKTPVSTRTLLRVQAALMRARDEPNSADAAHFIDVGTVGLVAAIADLRTQRAGIERGLEFHTQSVAGVAVVIGVLGLAALGSLVSLFMNRLVGDLRALGLRASQIVQGYRGDPLPLERSDEVGALARAVNSLAAGLVERDVRIEAERRQRHHLDKTAAMGTLASGMAHEIGNPVAVIAGVAQAIQDEKLGNMCRQRGLACHPRIILEQTERIAAITRRIADYARARCGSPEPVDLNALVTSTCDFVRFDRMFDGVAIVPNLDRDIGAVQTVAGYLIQLLSNCLANAARSRADRVEVCTREDGRGVVLEVLDNGDGGAYRQASPSPQPPDSGNCESDGLEMMVCRTLAQAMGGRISIAPRRDAGMRVALWLPQIDDRSGRVDS